jgi:pantetheine-phosphate adenylyltransferase
MRTVIYPGTFNPITNGHIDLAERAAKLFDRVVVAIAYSESKHPILHLKQRIELCQTALSHLDNIEVEGFNNLLVDFAKSKNSQVVLRGVRSVKDFEYEIQLAAMNKSLSPDLETLFLTPDDTLSHISSSLVREIASLGGDISNMVPSIVTDALNAHYND